MTDESYRSIAARVQSQIKVEGSKFIADVIPVTSAADAQAALQSVKTAFFDATHHCFAYSIGNEGTITRYSDDGEPSGTAGIKILSAINSKKISDVLVVVTRYFGGTKLGVGGLGRAYFTAATDGLQKGAIVEKTIVQDMIVRYTFADTNAVMNLAAKCGAKQEGSTYSAHEAAVTLRLKRSEVSRFIDMLNDATQGRVQVELGSVSASVIHH